MRKVLVVLTMLLGAPFLGAQSQQVTPFTVAAFMNLVATHPDKELRRELTGWYEKHLVNVVISDSVPFLEVSMLARTPTARPVLTLSVNPKFFTERTLLARSFRNPDVEKMEEYSEIYHEYVHLKKHMSGEWPLDPPADVQTLREQAQYVWGQEEIAYRLQWYFLRTKGYECLFFQSDLKPPEELDLEHTFRLRMSQYIMEEVRSYPEYRVFEPYWPKEYQETRKQSASGK